MLFRFPRPQAWLDRHFYLPIWAIGTRHDCEGIEVRTWLAEDERDEAVAKVCSALSLIRSMTPHGYARVRRDFRGILLFGLAGPLGGWNQAARLCLLDETFVQERSPERIAMTIVHEAMHARLYRHGVTYAEHLRPRIEKLCFRASASFARRLPNSGELQAETSRSMAIPDDYWTDAAFTERSLERLKTLSAPTWLKHLVRWRLKRKLSRGTPNKR